MAIIKGRLPFEVSLLVLPSADEEDDDGDNPLGLPSISRLLYILLNSSFILSSSIDLFVKILLNSSFDHLGPSSGIGSASKYKIQ